MKTIFTSFLLYSATLLNSGLSAQSYPYNENFDSPGTAPLPSGYSSYIPSFASDTIHLSCYFAPPAGGYNDKAMKIVNSIGMSNSKALVFRQQVSTLEYVDSLVTTPIGLLNSSSQLEFDYSFLYTPIACSPASVTIQPNSFSALDYGLTSPSFFRIYVLDLSSGNTVSLLHTIDSTNHTPTLAYQHKTINLSAYAGKNIRLMFSYRKQYMRQSLSSYFETAFNEFRMDNLAVSGNVPMPTSVKETENPLGITVYPNPTSDILKAESKELVKIRIYDIYGKVVFEEQNETRHVNIRLEQQPAGLYFMEVYNERQKQLLKIIKH